MNDDLKPLLMTVLEKLDTVLSDIGQLKADVATLKADVATLKADVATLKADVADLKAHAVRTDERLDVIEKTQASMAKDIASIDTHQQIITARINDQWNVVTTLIPTRIAAVGADARPDARARP